MEALHLRSDQQGAYAAYMNATKPDPAEDARRQAESRQLDAMTTPQRIDWTEAQMRADLQTMEQEGQAVKRFYQQLTPEQAAHLRSADRARASVSFDTLLSAGSLIAARVDWWISRRRGRRSWWPFWLCLAVGFALFSIFSPFGKARA